jgi:hypothetical protein
VTGSRRVEWQPGHERVIWVKSFNLCRSAEVKDNFRRSTPSRRRKLTSSSRRKLFTIGRQKLVEVPMFLVVQCLLTVLLLATRPAFIFQEVSVRDGRSSA